MYKWNAIKPARSMPKSVLPQPQFRIICCNGKENSDVILNNKLGCYHYFKMSIYLYSFVFLIWLEYEYVYSCLYCRHVSTNWGNFGRNNVSSFGPTGWNKILSMGKFNHMLTWLSIELFVFYQWYCNQELTDIYVMHMLNSINST